MLSKHLKIGGHYLTKVGGKIGVVLLERETLSGWEGKNITTGRNVWIKNPRSLRREASLAEIAIYSPKGAAELIGKKITIRVENGKAVTNPPMITTLVPYINILGTVTGRFPISSPNLRRPRPDDTYPPSKSDLLCLWAYYGVLRAGWENGPSHEEISSTLLNHLCNIGLNPTTEEGKRVLVEEGGKLGLKNLEGLVKDRSINPDN